MSLRRCCCYRASADSIVVVAGDVALVFVVAATVVAEGFSTLLLLRSAKAKLHLTDIRRAYFFESSRR